MLYVCLVAPFPPPYGGISHWATLVRSAALNSADVDMSIVDTAPRWRKVHQKSRMLRALGGGVQLLRDSYRFLRVALRSNLDVVHMATSGGMSLVRDVLILWVANALNVNVVWHIHYGRMADISGRSLECRLFLYVASRVARVVFIDQRSYQRFREILGADVVRCIPNCIDLKSLPQKQGHNGSRLRRVLFLGWVVKAKGIEELLVAWRSIVPSGWCLDIVGPCSEEYRTYLIRNFGSNGVNFLGEVSHGEAMGLLAEADVFALPSYTEGFPNVILEAMAMGLSILATRVGAIPEMLQGGCGVLIDPQDAEEVARGLSALLDDPALRSSVAKNAIERVSSLYSLEFVFDLYRQEWGAVR